MAINLYSKASVDGLLSFKLSVGDLSNAATTVLNPTAPTTGQALTFDGSDLVWATVGGAGGLTISTLSNGATSTLNATAPTTGQALTFDGTDLVWATVGGGGGSGTVTYSSPYLFDTVGSSNITAIDLGSGYLICNDVTGGNAKMDGFGLTLAAASGANIMFADGTTQSTAPHDLPIGGTTGQVLTKNSATNYDASWATASGGGGVNVQTFGSSSSSGTFTWTKPANAKWVEVLLWSGGGGGGSGARRATASGRSGGSGGAGGLFLWGRINATYLGSTETVTVGGGGAGGASVTSDNLNGNIGSIGQSTQFSIFQTYSCAVGNGGTTTGASAAASRASLVNYLNLTTGASGSGAISTGGTANANVTGQNITPTGGGGGGGAAASVTTNVDGGNGGQIAPNFAGIINAIAGGTGGTAAGVAATAGASATTQYTQGGTGGGGGFYRTGQAGGTGGNGGWPGGGGGGGGASDNGFASGKGGDGAKGFAVIITYT